MMMNPNKKIAKVEQVVRKMVKVTLVDGQSFFIKNGRIPKAMMRYTMPTKGQQCG